MTKVLPEPIDHFLLQADLTVIVPGPLERELAEQLAAVATVESAGAAMVYRISEQSIRRALDAGRTAGQLHALFARHSKTPVPQGLTYLIDDVARRHGQLRVGIAASFVRCEDPALLAQAVAAPQGELELQVLAPTVAVSQAPIAEVLAALRSAGFAPAAEDSSGTIVDIRARGARVPAPPRRRTFRPPPSPSSQTLGPSSRCCARWPPRRSPTSASIPPCAISQLQQAAHRQTSVVIGYVDPAGVATQRVVAPINVRGGQLTAYDPASGGSASSPSTASARWCRPNPDNGRVTDGPLIVQSDKTVLLEVDHELAGEARAAIAPFAELERAPEHIHTYRITPLALWNARAAGHDAEQVVDALVSFSRYAVPQPLLVDIVDVMARYGRLQLVKHPAHGLTLVSLDRAVLEEVLRNKKIAPMLGTRIDDDTVVVHNSERGRVKQMLLKIGWPAEDLAGYVDGEAHPISLRQDGWHLRDYQEMATESFWSGGSGVVVLPCGAGKTLVGAAAMAKAGATTLILVTNTVAGRQWKRELVNRTSLTEDEIGEYSGERKEIRPVTIATYQVITRRTKGEYRHLELFDSRDWGLIIYDEVHLLPAPVFRMTADLQSRRRLGLTATLIREDGREGDVFSLIGPKRYDAPWKDIEAQGWIAPAECIEVRVTMTDNERMLYAVAEPDERYRLCSTVHTKIAVVKSILERHPGDQTLVIGAYLDQLDELGEQLNAPVIQGSTKTPNGRRCSTRSAAARCPRWWCPRWPTSPSTCRKPMWRCRFRGRSGHDRKRLSGWDGCCGPSPTAAVRCSTRWSPVTAWTPNTPRTGSGSWPNRATAT